MANPPGHRLRFRVMISYVRDRLTRLSVLSSRPAAFFVVLGYGVLWFFFARDTFDWHALAALATWMMTVFIQLSGHRDSKHSTQSSIICSTGSTLPTARWRALTGCSPRT